MSVDKPNMLSMDFSKDYASMVFKRLLLKPRGHCIIKIYLFWVLIMLQEMCIYNWNCKNSISENYSFMIGLHLRMIWPGH